MISFFATQASSSCTKLWEDKLKFKPRDLMVLQLPFLHHLQKFLSNFGTGLYNLNFAIQWMTELNKYSESFLDEGDVMRQSI